MAERMTADAWTGPAQRTDDCQPPGNFWVDLCRLPPKTEYDARRSLGILGMPLAGRPACPSAVRGFGHRVGPTSKRTALTTCTLRDRSDK